MFQDARKLKALTQLLTRWAEHRLYEIEGSSKETKQLLHRVQQELHGDPFIPDLIDLIEQEKRLIEEYLSKLI